MPTNIFHSVIYAVGYFSPNKKGLLKGARTDCLPTILILGALFKKFLCSTGFSKLYHHRRNEMALKVLSQGCPQKNCGICIVCIRCIVIISQTQNRNLTGCKSLIIIIQSSYFLNFRRSGGGDALVVVPSRPLTNAGTGLMEFLGMTLFDNF